MNRIRECRQNKKLTLKQLSEELAKHDFNISADALGKYERGNREPKLETWIKLAFYFNVPVSYIQGLTNNQNTNGYIMSPDDTLVSELIRFNSLFTKQKYELSDGEKTDLTRTVDQLTGLLEKYIPLTSDNKKIVGEKKEMLTMIHSLINSLYFLLVISNKDEQKQAAINETKNFVESLAKIWNGPVNFD